jgi:hypothetical protein
MDEKGVELEIIEFLIGLKCRNEHPVKRKQKSE